MVVHINFKGIKFLNEMASEKLKKN